VANVQTRWFFAPGSSRSRATVALVIACGFWMLQPLAPCRAAQSPDTLRENQLRAGYLLNFAKFVEWPALGATELLTVCFVGGTGIRDSFTTGAGKQIGTHSFVTRTLSARASPQGCQVLYVEAAAPFSREYTSVAAVNPALLTVGDGEDFLHAGGIVELFADSNRLRFNVNLDNARRAGLRISSSLLQLASHVEGAGQ